MKQFTIAVSLIMVAVLLSVFDSLSPKAHATSGTMVFVVQNQSSSARTSTPNLIVATMNENMAKENGAYGDKMQTFIRDATTDYYLTKSNTITITGSSYAIFQNAGSTNFYIYRNGDMTNYLLCLAGTNCPEGIR